MPLLGTPQRADLKVSATLGFQFSHDEPIRQQSGEKNQHSCDVVAPTFRSAGTARSGCATALHAATC